MHQKPELLPPTFSPFFTSTCATRGPCELCGVPFITLTDSPVIAMARSLQVISSHPVDLLLYLLVFAVLKTFECQYILFFSTLVSQQHIRHFFDLRPRVVQPYFFQRKSTKCRTLLDFFSTAVVFHQIAHSTKRFSTNSRLPGS